MQRKGDGSFETAQGDMLKISDRTKDTTESDKMQYVGAFKKMETVVLMKDWEIKRPLKFYEHPGRA